MAADPAPPAPAFVPAFRTAIGSGLDNEGNPVSWNLNSTYFATKDTAQWIANKYGTGKVSEVPFGGSGGPFSASANEYAIQLADGRQVQRKIGRAWTGRGRPAPGYLTKRTAEAWLSELLSEARRGTLPGMVRTGVTLADAAAEWLRYSEHERAVKRST